MDTTRRLVWATVIILVIWLAALWISERYSPTSAGNLANNSWSSNSGQISSAQSSAMDLADASCNVDGVQFTLNDGVATVPGGGTFQLYQATYGDLVGNGEQDAAVTLINNSGGSGVFSYVAAVLANGSSTPAVFLGDRIETESIMIRDGVIIVNYEDRGANQPFSTPPTIQKVAEYTLVNGQLQPKTD